MLYRREETFRLMSKELVSAYRYSPGMFSFSAAAIVLLCVIQSNILNAQERTRQVTQEKSKITGIVRDSETFDPLPGANIRIVGTARGATTNAEGAYRILLPAGKHEIVLSFLGYFSDTLRLTLHDEHVNRNVFLRPAVLAMPEVTVYGTAGDPADEIIRKAIQKKQEILSQLRSLEFSAYSKVTSRARRKKGESVDTIMGLVMESQLKGYWKAPDYYKEIITARKQTANLPAEMNIFGLRRLPNLNDDDVLLFEHRVAGPTSSRAFDYYSFQMLDTTVTDDIMVWRIRVTPKIQLLPLFDGVIWIADKTFFVMKVDVRGNEPLNVPPFTDIHLRQQFALYEEKFWLPIEMHFTSILRFSFIPGVEARLQFNLSAVIHEYRINQAIPDALFDRFAVSVDPQADRVDSAAWHRQQLIPLTADEVYAYHLVDSIMSAPGWRKDVAMMLIKGPIWISKLPITEFSDFFRFNRVEGTRVGIGFDSKALLSSTRIRLRGGYGFSDERWKYGLETEQFLSRDQNFSIGGEVHRSLNARDESGSFSATGVTFLSLFYKNDPLVYYATQGFSLFTRFKPSSDFSIEARYRDERHSSVVRNTNFSFFRRSREYRLNPPILDGRLRSTSVSLSYDTRKFVETGWFTTVDETRESWTMSAAFEYSDRSYLRSDFNFSRSMLSIHRRLFTFGSGKLGLYAQFVWSARSLPPQRLIDMPSGASGIIPQRAMRLLGVREFSGDRMALIQIEHDFGNMFFRVLGLPVVKDMDFIIFAGSGWSDLSSASSTVQTVPVPTARKLYHEIGFGIGRLPPFLRLDFTWRLTHRTGRNFQVTLGSACM